MKAYLHIGTPKTATTTIQSFLAENREPLLKRGYIVSQAAGTENNLYLAVSAYDLKRRDELTRLNGICSDQQLIDLQERIVDGLKAEVQKYRRLNPAANTVIYSSEYLHLLLKTPEELNRLKEILKSIGFCKIEVLVYLRDPASLAASYYSTSVKVGVTHDAPQPPEQPRYEELCNHKKTLERYAKVFGERNVTPRIFEKSSLIKHSIISDFTDLLGISDLNAFKIPDIKNKTLSAMGMQIQRTMNTIFPRRIGDELNPLVPIVLDKVMLKYPGKGAHMSDTLRLQYEKYFRDSNEWVRKRYFPDRESLFEGSVSYNGPEKTVQVNCEDSARELAYEILEEVCRQPSHVLWEKSRQIPAPYASTKLVDTHDAFDHLMNVSLGVSYFNLDSYDKAIELFKIATVSSKYELEASVYLALSLSRLGDCDSADKLYSKLLRRYPQKYRVQRLYALNAEQQNSLDEAEERWREILFQFPDNNEALMKIGICQLKLSNYDEAIRNFDKLLQDNGENKAAIYFKERCLAKTG